MTIDDLIEGRIEGLTMDNFPAPQVETVEVPIFIIPTWIKWVCGLGILALLFFLIRDFIKTVVIQKHLKEIEQLKSLQRINLIITDSSNLKKSRAMV